MRYETRSRYDVAALLVTNASGRKVSGEESSKDGSMERSRGECEGKSGVKNQGESRVKKMEEKLLTLD
jgi:hypothetical protein